MLGNLSDEIMGDNLEGLMCFNVTISRPEERSKISGCIFGHVFIAAFIIIISNKKIPDDLEL